MESEKSGCLSEGWMCDKGLFETLACCRSQAALPGDHATKFATLFFSFSFSLPLSTTTSQDEGVEGKILEVEG